jgi:hypothetical protein
VYVPFLTANAAYVGAICQREGHGGGTLGSTSRIQSPPSSWDVPSQHLRQIYVMRHTGIVLVAASVVVEYGFPDIDGKTPRALTLADV